jgi:hypothetical protein
VRVFDVTGNNLTVYEHFFHLTLGESYFAAVPLNS